MSWNNWKRLQNLIAGPQLDAGEVLEVRADGVTLQLRSGALITARGQAQVGDHVYVRGGVIEGPAPDLPGVDQEV